MLLLRRYVVVEFIKVFVVALIAVVMVLVLSEVVKELIRKGFTAGQIGLVLPFVLPYSLKIAIHGAVLFAACSVFGRMSADNEILAAKSVGITPISLLVPVFVAMVPLSVFAVWLDEVDGTWGCEGVQRQVVEHFDEIAVEFLKREHYFETSQFQVAVRGVRGHELLLPAVKIRGATDITILAESGEIRRGISKEGLRLTLRSGTVLSNDYHYSFSDVMEMDLCPPIERQEAYTWERYERQRASLDRLEQQVAAELQKAATERRPPDETLMRTAELERHQSRRLMSQCFNKWANGFCCLCFVMIGAPAAILLRFGHWLASFFTCFMPIILVYQPLQQVPINMSEAGYIPSACVFLTDLFLCGVGVALCWRVHTK